MASHDRALGAGVSGLKRKSEEITSDSIPTAKRMREDNDADLEEHWRYDSYRTPIQIKVENCKKTFLAHRELLCNWSKVVGKELKGTYGESPGTRSFKLKFLGQETMHVFLTWMYTRELVPFVNVPAFPFTARANAAFPTTALMGAERLWNHKKADLGITSIELDAAEMHLVTLFVFAHHYDITRLMNDAVTSLAALSVRSGRGTCAAAANKAYEFLPPGSPLLKYLYEQAWTNINPNFFPASTSAFCPEYLGDVLRLLLSRPEQNDERTGNRCPRIEIPCRYHRHSAHPAEDGLFRGELCKAPSRLSTGKPQTHLHALIDHFANILVGPQKQPFLVHKRLLCRKSPFFSRALKGKFAEGSSMTVTLTNEAARVFRLFLTWLYNREIRIPPRQWKPTPYVSTASSQESDTVIDLTDDASEAAPEDPTMDDDNDEQEWKQRNLIDLYIFADRRDVRLLRNQVINELIHCGESTKWHLTTTYFEHVRLAYDNLPSESLLIKYLVDKAVWFWEQEQLADADLHTLPPQFLASVLSTTSRSQRGRSNCTYAPWRHDVCEFHEHETDEERRRCKTNNAKWQEGLRNKIGQKRPTSTRCDESSDEDAEETVRSMRTRKRMTQTRPNSETVLGQTNLEVMISSVSCFENLREAPKLSTVRSVIAVDPSSESITYHPCSTVSDPNYR